MENRRHKFWGSLILALLGVVWFGVALGGCRPETAERERKAEVVEAPVQYQGTIVAMGDSLTAGLGVDEEKAYPAQLERKLAAEGYAFRVINAGISGETSSGALSRLEWVLRALRPDILILETGANDGLRGIDPSVLRANLDSMLTTLKENGVVVVLAGMQMLPNLGPEYIQAFNTLYPAMAGKYGVIFMPFFLEGVAGDSQFNQPDRLHPTADGYRRIVENLYPYVVRAIRIHQNAPDLS